jgi:tetratricopeptide (TPR) repeat protein
LEKGWEHKYEAAKKAFEARKYDHALDLLQAISSEKNSYPDVFNMLGLVFYYFQRYDDAVLAFKRAIELNPNYTEASLNLSVVYNEIGSFEDSQKAYALARESRQESHSYLDPYVRGKIANMHSTIGSIYKDLGYYPQAAEEFRKALVLRPEFADIKTELGTAYRDMREFPRAIKELQDAVRLDPGYPAPRIQLGLTYYLMGHLDRARTEWLHVLKTHPEDKLAQMYMNLLRAPSS